MFTEEETMDGRRIKYYRLKKGLTTEALAKAIGCTKAAISLYESGEREPNAETIKKIADTLSVPWVELLPSNNNNLFFNHADFRKIQKASKKDIEILLMDIESKCLDRISLMRILGLSYEKPFKTRHLSKTDSPSLNAAKIRMALGFPNSGPIYSITDVLEHSGIIVLSFDCADEIDGLNGTVNGIPYIFFNSKNRTIERQRFTIIHEVCHLFFKDDDDSDLEKYINKVAGNVLIPDEDIYYIFGKTNREITVYLRNDVARKYRIAPSCLINRLLEAGVITQIYHKKFFIILNRNGGRKAEKTLLDETRDSESPVFFTQQVYLALASELISASKASEYLHIPLYDVMQNMMVD